MTADIERIRRRLALARLRGDLVSMASLERALCVACGQPGRCLCRRVTPRLTTHRASRAVAGISLQRQPGASVGPLPRD